MSTVSEMFPPREFVLIIDDGKLVEVLYQSLNEGMYYVVELISGSFSVYKKTKLFDDQMIEKVKTSQAAIELISKLNS